MIFQKGYTPAYIAAAIANCWQNGNSERRKFSGATLEDIQLSLHREYGVEFDSWNDQDNLDLKWIEAGLALLVAHGAAQIDEDPFAGTNYSIDWEVCEILLNNEAADPESLARMLIGGNPSWIKRALEGMIANRELSDNAFEHSPTDTFAPAADRIVARSDNQLDFDQSVKDLEKLIEEVRQQNDFASEMPAERDAVLANLAAGSELLKRDHFWLRSVFETLIKGLKYLVKKFTDSSIGLAAKKLLTLLISALDLG